MRVLTLDDDRLLPTEPGVRAVAREIFAAVRALPLVSMHGHVDAALLSHNLPFPDPARLLVVPDHYVTRMLVSQGESLDRLGVARSDGEPVESDPREIWRRFCAGWHLFRGTPSRLWLEHELVQVFGVELAPSAESADLLYDELSAALRRPAFRPRALFERFNIELLATTDSPLSDLAEHLSILESGWPGVVVPTFRPDALIQLNHPGWQASMQTLADVSGIPTGTYSGYITALEQRRNHFRRLGARATDHGVYTADTEPLDAGAASRIYQSALRGRVTPEQCQAFSAHMMFEMARMSRDDGLVMQIHPGVQRDHDPAVRDLFGTDQGFDIPVTVDFVHGLRPMLNAFGHDPGFRCIVFTIDETDLLARARTDGRRLPRDAARCALVVSRLAGRHAPVPRVGHRDCRLLQHERVCRRHKGFRLDPGSSRRGPTGRCGLPRRAGRTGPARARRGDGDRDRPCGHHPAGGVRVARLTYSRPAASTAVTAPATASASIPVSQGNRSDQNG